MGLLDIFKKAKGPFERRVFAVTEATLAQTVMDMIKDHEAAVWKAFTAIMNPENNQEQRQDSFTKLAERPSDRKTLDALVSLEGWPGSLKVKNMAGCWCGENGAEAVLHKGQMYITIPTIEHVEKEYDEPEALAALKAWTPPAGLEEIDPAILPGGRGNPVGFPRASYSIETTSKFKGPTPKP
jgi:hypothetical protein